MRDLSSRLDPKSAPELTSEPFPEHPLTLSDSNFSLGSAAVGVSPLESADPEGSGVRVAWETTSRKPRREAKLRVYRTWGGGREVVLVSARQPLPFCTWAMDPASGSQIENR